MVNSPHVRLQESSVNGYRCATDPGEPGKKEGRLSINDAEGHILEYLVGGRTVLEIGTGLGVSTRYMAKSAKLVITCDIDPWVQENIWPDLQRLPNVTTTKDLNNLGRQFDVVFIDGCHKYGACMDDITNTRQLLKSDGFYLLHDFYQGDVKKAIIDAKLFWTLIETWAGIAIAWQLKPRKEF